MDKVFLAIDLKSFYASVECMRLGYDPLNTNLVVADNSRTNKTICLAVSPSLKEYGIKGRPRLYEVEEKIREINYYRKKNNGGRPFRGKSCYKEDLDSNRDLELDYIVAPPNMKKYIDFSARIYEVYLKWFSKEDIHVYSIDEVFIDASSYMSFYGDSVEDLAESVVLDVVKTTGITATVGIGTNLFLAKVAMDIKAKKAEPNDHGCRLAFLDEKLFREEMWTHKPLDDFWRIGRGYRTRLEGLGLYTLGDVARFSLTDEDLLFKAFGVNAELLIDHAWGVEPCSLADIKNYKPESRSIGSGQVLHRPYSFSQARIVILEMAEALSLELFRKSMLIDHISIGISYDKENFSDPKKLETYRGEIKYDMYGRKVPKSSRGSENLGDFTSSTRKICQGVLRLFDRVAREELLIRKMSISFNNMISKEDYQASARQLDMFSSFGPENIKDQEEEAIQRVLLEIKARFGKNAILKGTNFFEGATGRERNDQIGGHKS